MPQVLCPPSVHIIIVINHYYICLFHITGVHVKIPQYGSVEGIEYLDDTYLFGVWDGFIKVLTAIGYERGTTFSTFEMKCG